MHIKDLFDLKDKVVLVTGGAGKYGKSIVEAFAESQAKVIISSRSYENCSKIANSLKEKSYHVDVITYDQSNFDSILNLKKEIEKKYGRLDVFVNNAFSLPMLNYNDPIEAFESSMKVNATGVFFILREMAEFMSRNNGGSIINIGSMKGSYSPDFDLYVGTDMDSPPDYNFHKGGIISLTKYFARKLANKNIRINTISPGGLYANQPNEFVDKYCKKVPLGRMANQNDIKGVVVFLASKASDYINGTDILMDGGLYT